ncbi:uncharacterized protein LOC144093948 isoform X2 [Amblyomma americanum]
MERWLRAALLLAASTASVAGLGRGKLPASFQAMGQSYTLSDCSPEARASESPIAAGFRESYRVDPDTGDKRAALVVDLGTIPAVRFVEDSALNETVQIADGRCSRVNMDALNMQNIHLLKDEKGSVAFPVLQMLSLPEPNEQPVRGTCRGQPCVTWTVRQQPVTRKGDDGSLIVSREVYSLVWTDFTAENSWSSMSQERNVPLELRLCRVENVTRPDDNSTETTTQLNVVEILHFTHNAVFGDDLEVHMDTLERLYRIDFTPETAYFNNITVSRSVKSVSRIISGTSGLVFDIQSLKNGKTRCQRRAVKRLPFMKEAVIDFQDMSELSPDLFFGTNRTKYVLKKKARKRGIPCNVWQGRRNDWPPGENVTTVWEWCLREEKEKPATGMWDSPSLPLVSLEIYHSQTADDIHDDEIPHENWKKLTFSFYRVDSANKWVTDLQAFDVTECMDEDIDPMQFELKYPETKYEDVVNITIEPLFLAMCKYHIVQSLKSKFGVLRVGKLRAAFDKEKKLHIQFALLGKFPNIKGEPTLEELQGSLEQDVDAGVLKISMTAPGKQESIEFTAVPHSLRSADEDFSPSNEPARRPTPVTLFRSGQPGWSVQNVTLDYPMPALLYRSQAHHESSVASKNGTTGHTKTVHVVIFVGAALGLFAIGAMVGVVSLRLQRIVR